MSTEVLDLGHAITLPPRKAIAYFKAKGYQVSWDWWEVWQGTHAQAFTVAKAMRLDILQGIRSELDKTLAEGLTEHQFIKALSPTLQSQGWWGRQVIVDKQGEAQRVQLGSPWRLKTIYRTNMNTAYAAARYRQQRDNCPQPPLLAVFKYAGRRRAPAPCRLAWPGVSL